MSTSRPDCQPMAIVSFPPSPRVTDDLSAKNYAADGSLAKIDKANAILIKLCWKKPR
jgi:hypothetical protein